MTGAPLFLKMMVVLLSCGVCISIVGGLVSKNAVTFQIAGSCLALAAIIVVGWRVRHKSGDV
ncbi:MAG: hypothetical protein V3U57_10380 [Robiginitomaculum sp.]